MASETDQVVKLDLGFKPEAAISGEVLVQTERSTFLTFNAMGLGPDGIHYRGIGFALLEFNICLQTRFGLPNDEALPGHPLYSKGVQTYAMYEVLNSSWIDQLAEQNRVKFPTTTNFDSFRHFILTFHESIFECVAEGFTSEVFDGPYEQLFARIAERVMSG